MRQAVISVDADLLAERGLSFEVFQEAGLRDTELLSCEGSRGVIRIHVEEELDPERLEAMDGLEWWEQVATDGPGYAYLIEAADTDGWDETPAEESPFPRCEHIRVTDDGITLTWAGPQDRLQDELDRLETAGTTISLEQLRGYRAPAEPLDSLTDRQSAVLEFAFDHGYFEVPRQVSVQAIAAEFELDDSTVAEHLQRAERNLLRALFGRSS